jgi:hypothetical protein
MFLGEINCCFYRGIELFFIGELNCCFIRELKRPLLTLNCECTTDTLH